MSDEIQPSRLARETAEKVLQKIYGDDFAGCTVNFQDIAVIVQRGLEAEPQQARDLIGALNEVLQAIETLSTPPEKTEIRDRVHLDEVLSERMDAIRTIALKALGTLKTIEDQRR